MKWTGTQILAFVVLPLATSIACSDSSGTPPVSPVVAAVDVVLLHNEIEVGQQDTAIAVARNANGVVIDPGSAVTWTSSFPEVATINPVRGEILGIASGQTEIIATVGGVSGRRKLIASPPAILINEVNPNGNLPGGWVELYNPTASPVDLAGWTITSGVATESFTIPNGVIIEPGGFAAVNEVTLPNPFNATGSVQLFSKYGVLSDTYGWFANPPGNSYGRCPDGIGQFVEITTPTRKAPNTCP